MRISDRLVFFFYQSIKLLLIPVGIHTISSIFQAFDIAERQADWVTTKARVTQSQNVFIDDTKRCRFKYEYVADKQQFSNWRYSADGRKCAGTAKFKTSDAISIYYDPDNPASSVVERLPPSAWFLVTRGLGGLLTIGVGLYTVAPMIADLLSVGRMLHNAQNSSEPAIHKSHVQRNSAQIKGMRAGDIGVTLLLGFHEGILGTQRTLVFDRLKLNSDEGLNLDETAILVSKSVTVTVPAGIEQGTRLRIAGLGDAKSDGSVGDLYICLEMPYEYENLTREAGNILSILQLTAAQAAQGGQFPIRVVDGEVMVTVPPSTDHNARLKLKGQGVPVLGNPTVRGDHIFVLHIVPDIG